MRTYLLLFAFIFQIAGSCNAGDDLRVIGPRTQLAKSDCNCINSGDITIDNNDKNAIVSGLRGDEWVLEVFPLNDITNPTIITTSPAWLGRPQILGGGNYIFLSEEISGGEYGFPQAVEFNSTTKHNKMLSDELFLINDFKFLKNDLFVMNCELLQRSIVLIDHWKKIKISTPGVVLKLEGTFNGSLLGYWTQGKSRSYNFYLYSVKNRKTKHQAEIKGEIYNYCASNDLSKIFYESATDSDSGNIAKIYQRDIASGKTQPVGNVDGKIMFMDAGNRYIGCTYINDKIGGKKFKTIIIDLESKKIIPLCDW
jgi:hypothetical protein